MSDQTNRGSSHSFKQMNLALKKSNEKLDVLIELITQLLKEKK
jgi:hypothetical protein|tara:strand:- start:393 stop:521 length:129 start_codon:yes stop_codon:yes gene_type:complete